MNTQAPDMKKRPGDLRQDTNRTAQTNYQEEAAAVNDSTRTHRLGQQGGVQMSPTGERGVLHLGMVQNTGDAVIFSLTTDQARDLADSIFIGADQIDAADEAADLEGDSTFTLGAFTRVADRLGVNASELADALDEEGALCSLKR